MTQRITPPTALVNRATAGNASAQFELAELYMHSEHEDDIDLAEQWALRAAQLGHIEAMYWLGEGYTAYAKELREEDPEESKKYFEYGHNWLSEAVKDKHPAAIFELAGYYRRGDFVEKDVAKSIELVEQAAKLGEVQAMRDLSFIYANGLGIDADQAKADEWADKAEVIEPTVTQSQVDSE